MKHNLLSIKDLKYIILITNKLVVFENKVINLAFRNELIEDEEKKKIYLKKVEKLITVCK